MGDKIIMKIKPVANVTSTGGHIIEVPFGIGIKSYVVLTTTGSGIASTDTLQVSISEMDVGTPTSSGSPTTGESATKLNYGAATPLIAHSVITGSLLNSGAQTMPFYDVKDWVETATGSPRIMSPMLHCKWNITGSGQWSFRHYIVIEK